MAEFDRWVDTVWTPSKESVKCNDPCLSCQPFAEEKGDIDASDPTKIYTYAGAGVKYTDYTNGESMQEVRATGNIGLGSSDMVLFELGYGWHDGDSVPGDDNGLTNGRLRWFHLFKMDYSKVSGYRGMATQLDLQIAGALKGTDGQNVVSAGVLPAFGISDLWSFYCAFNLVGSWDKKFENYNGTGAGIAPRLVFTPDWWNGSFVQLWPNYTVLHGGAAGRGVGERRSHRRRDDYANDFLEPRRPEAAR